VIRLQDNPCGPSFRREPQAIFYRGTVGCQTYRQASGSGLQALDSKLPASAPGAWGL